LLQSDASQGGRRRRQAPERRSQRQMEREMKDEAEKIRKENQVSFVCKKSKQFLANSSTCQNCLFWKCARLADIHQPGLLGLARLADIRQPGLLGLARLAKAKFCKYSAKLAN
jgi:hypothetical protein